MRYRWIDDHAPGWLKPKIARLRASPLGKRVAKGVFWSAFGAVASRVLTLLASIVTARIVGKSGFGELGIVQSTALMFGSFASFGMGLTAIKYIAENRVKDPPLAGRIIGMSTLVSWASGLAIAGLVALFAPWLAVHTLASAELGPYLRVGSLCVLFNVVGDAQQGILSGMEAFRRRSVVQFTAGLLSFPIAVGCVWVWGLGGAVWALAAAQGLVVLLNFVAIARETLAARIPVAWRLSRRELAVFWEFSLPSLLAGLVYVPAIWLANTIVVNQPGGYAQMGVFSAADRWRTAIVFLPSLLAGVALPLLANLRGGGERRRFTRVLWTNVRLSFLLSLLASVPVMIASRWIMRAYGAGFASGSWVLVGLCFVAVISATSWILIQSIISAGRMWLIVALNVTWASLLVGTCWFLRRHGDMALVAAYLAAESARLGLVMILARSKSTLAQAPEGGHPGLLREAAQNPNPS